MPCHVVSRRALSACRVSLRIVSLNGVLGAQNLPSNSFNFYQHLQSTSSAQTGYLWDALRKEALLHLSLVVVGTTVQT